MNKPQHHDWERTFMCFYDGVETGGSSRWLVSPCEVKCFIHNEKAKAKKKGWNEAIDEAAKKIKKVKTTTVNYANGTTESVIDSKEWMQTAERLKSLKK